jgi:hypothetical protein
MGMTIESASSPTADPADNGPDPDRWASAARMEPQMPADDAAMRALERTQLDNMSVVAFDVLRVLRIEVLDPDHASTDIPGTRVRASDPTLAYVRLTRAMRLSLAARARMAVEDAEAGVGETPAETALRRQRESQIVIGASSIGMDLLRVLQQEVLAHWKAPTMGQGLWVHAGDPARAVELLTRAIRLNHAIRAKIAEGSLGQKRRAKAAAPERQAGRQSAVSAADHAAREAAHDSGRAELSEIDGEAAETERFETGWNESESEDLWSELQEDLDREWDEFGFLGDMLPNAVSSLAQREFERYVGIYRPRDRRTAASDTDDTDDPAEDQDPPDSSDFGIVGRLRAGLDTIRELGGPTEKLQNLGDQLDATERLLRKPGRDPPG